jgi:uncharacterized protein YbjT (DUF2867 family)
MGNPQFAVTGATGALGGDIASALAAAGASQRLVVRDPSRAPSLPGTEVAVASYDDPDALAAAFAGIPTLFMVSAAENENRVAQHYRCVDAAAAAGVERIVYTSFFKAGPQAVFTLGRDHWATEERIRASGMTWTFLRDNFYADFLPLTVDEGGVIRGPAGAGRVSAVVRRDVAAVATRVLLEAGQHDRASYDLTGPEALSMQEVAERLTAALGRSITYHDETIEEAYASRAKYEAPGWLVDAWVSTYTSIASGEVADVSRDVERITGRPATSLAELLTAGE